MNIEAEYNTHRILSFYYIVFIGFQVGLLEVIFILLDIINSTIPTTITVIPITIHIKLYE